MAIFVLSITILLFFAKEFSELFKKIISIPGVILIVPLFLVSLLVEAYEPFFLWLLLQFKKGLHSFLQMVSQSIPIHPKMAHIILLVLCGIVPFLILRTWEKINKITFIRSVTYITGVIVWITAAVLLTI